MAKQISILVEDKPGRIKNVTKLLDNNGIHIKAITIDRGPDYGAIKLLVDKPNKAINVFKKNNIPIKATEVIVLKMGRYSRGIFEITKVLSSKGINIKDVYGFVTKPHRAGLLVIEVSQKEKVKKILKAKGIEVLTNSQVYNL